MQNIARKTFLVLEDDADDATLIRRALSNAACQAFVCRNTSEAKAYVQGAGMYADRHRFPDPDVFITDLRLGEDSGVDFLAWLRDNNYLQGVPVVILSGAATPADLLAVKHMDVTRVILKPSDTIALQDLLIELQRELCPTSPRQLSNPHRFETDNEDTLVLP